MPELHTASVRRFLIAFVSVLLVGLIFYSFQSITADHARTLAVAEQETRSYAAALHEHADRAFGEADRALATVAESINARGGLKAVGERELHDLLLANARNAPQIGSIFVVDRTGAMPANSLQFPMKPVNVADRDYFTFHQSNPDRGIYISSPFKGRVVNKWRFTMSQPLKDRRGQFDGLVAVAFEIDYFQKFYASLNQNVNSRFLLTRSDGTLLVVQPLKETAFFTDFKKNSALATKYLPKSPVGTFHVTNPLIGKESRIVSYKSLDRYPIVAVISFSIHECMAPWLKRATTNALTMGTLCVVVAVLTTLLIRQLKRLEAAHALLVDQQDVERKLNEELEQRVTERTIQWKAANDALQREIEQHKQAQEEVTWLNEDLIRQQNALVIANRELEAFSYSVSHDLRAPLRHLCGFVNILLEDHVDALDETATMYLSRIYNASQKMGALIDSLLELSRISRYKMHISSVYLTLLAREIAESLQDTAPNRHVTWQIAEDLVVQADETLMRNVLENLLGNAWKYTGQKDLAIIEFASCIQGGEQVYFVRDNGTGFDMAHRDKLFGAFQRLHGTEFDGMGIGLATVQRIIHRHNGDIWAEAAQDEGATFYFTLSKQ
jgi:signal transduction histidine kinase